MFWLSAVHDDSKVKVVSVVFQSRSFSFEQTKRCDDIAKSLSAGEVVLEIGPSLPVVLLNFAALPVVKGNHKSAIHTPFNSVVDLRTHSLDSILCRSQLIRRLEHKTHAPLAHLDRAQLGRP